MAAVAELSRKSSKAVSPAILGANGQAASAPPKVTSAVSVVTSSNNLEFAYESEKEAFPDVDPGLKPLGAIVLVQVRHPKRVTAKGILLPEEARSTEHYNTQVAKVIALGPLCFQTVKQVESRNPTAEPPRDVMVPYIEGAWFKVGDYVRIPRYVGDRFEVPFERTELVTDPDTGRKERETKKDNIVFSCCKAKDIIGLITADPLKVKAFLDC